MDFMAAIKAPAKADPMDPKPLVALFDLFKDRITAMYVEAQEQTVDSDADLEQASEKVVQAKKLAKAIDKKRLELKQPYHAVIKVLDGETKVLKDQLKAIQNDISSKIGPYLQKKEAARKEAERKAAEAARAIQEKIDAERKAANETGEIVKNQPVSVVPQFVPPAVVNTETGKVKLKTKTVGHLIDVRKLPDDIINDRFDAIERAVMPAINARIKIGMRDIPGVKIVEEAEVDARVNF